MDVEIPQPSHFFLIGRKLFWLVAVSILGIYIYNSFFIGPSVSRDDITLALVKNGNILETIQATGYLKASKQKQIISEVDGIVEEIFIHSGQSVKANTPILALVNPKLIEAQRSANLALKKQQIKQKELELILLAESASLVGKLKLSKADLLVAESKYEATIRLTANGLVSKLELKNIESTLHKANIIVELAQEAITRNKKLTIIKQESITLAVEQAEQVLSNANSRVHKLVIRPQYAGLIDSIDSSIQLGTAILAGKSIARVSKKDTLLAVLSIPGSRADKLKLGMKVNLKISANNVQAQIDQIDGAIIKGRVWFRASIIGELPSSARPDLEIWGDVQTKKIDNSLYIPFSAAIEANGKQLLFIEQDNMLVRKQVTLGLSSTKKIQVLAGLKIGDKVLTSHFSHFLESELISLD